jgi:hypothetical protein
MSLCLASVWALASPVLVTVLFGSTASANSCAGTGLALLDACAPAHGVVHVRQALQQGLNLLPLGTHNLWRAASATRTRGPGRRAAATPARRCPQRARFFRSLGVTRGAGVSGNSSQRLHPLNAPSFEKLASRLSTSPSSFRAWALRVSKTAHELRRGKTHTSLRSTSQSPEAEPPAPLAEGAAGVNMRIAAKLKAERRSQRRLRGDAK